MSVGCQRPFVEALETSSKATLTFASASASTQARASKTAKRDDPAESGDVYATSRQSWMKAPLNAPSLTHVAGCGHQRTWMP